MKMTMSRGSEPAPAYTTQPTRLGTMLRRSLTDTFDTAPVLTPSRARVWGSNPRSRRMRLGSGTPAEILDPC
jgi:hypothetical protein